MQHAHYGRILHSQPDADYVGWFETAQFNCNPWRISESIMIMILQNWRLYRTTKNVDISMFRFSIWFHFQDLPSLNLYFSVTVKGVCYCCICCCCFCCYYCCVALWHLMPGCLPFPLQVLSLITFSPLIHMDIPALKSKLLLNYNLQHGNNKSLDEKNNTTKMQNPIHFECHTT